MTSDTLTLAIGLLERAHFSAASEREARDLVVKALQDSKAAPPPAAVGEVAEEMDRRADAEAQRCHDAGIEGESAVELLALAKCEVWRVAAQMLRSLPAAPPAAEAATKETP